MAKTFEPEAKFGGATATLGRGTEDVEATETTEATEAIVVPEVGQNVSVESDQTIPSTSFTSTPSTPSTPPSDHSYSSSHGACHQDCFVSRKEFDQLQNQLKKVQKQRDIYRKRSNRQKLKIELYEKGKVPPETRQLIVKEELEGQLSETQLKIMLHRKGTEQSIFKCYFCPRKPLPYHLLHVASHNLCSLEPY